MEAGKFVDTQKGKGLISVTGLTPGDSLGISLLSYRRGKIYPAEPYSTKIFEVNEPVTSYMQNFNNGTDDFTGDGYFITKFSGFDDFAIHSRHPYPEGTGHPGDTLILIYQLRTPVIVAAQNALFKYKDIAIIETGEPGTQYPDERFYDYVVMEGSDDGLHWKALAPGYDANKDSRWLSAYTGNKKGDKSMFLDEQIDLHDTFEAGDTIFIRLKLYSDPLTNAWGWCVDDFNIQGVITALEDELPDIRVYPNPFENLINIKYSLAEESRVHIRLIDIRGRVVENIDLGVRHKGQYVYTVQNRNLSPGLYVLNVNLGEKTVTRKVIVQ